MTNSKQPITSRGRGLLDRALVMGPYRISLFPPLPSVQTVFEQSLSCVAMGLSFASITAHSRFPSNARASIISSITNHFSPITPSARDLSVVLIGGS